MPVGVHGDVFDRYMVRVEEVKQSLGIVRQVLETMPAGDFRTDDRKVTPPPRKRIDESMEALIHHFKIFTEGFKVPAGEAYQAVESPRGELGVYIVSDGGAKPWRLHVRGTVVRPRAGAAGDDDRLPGGRRHRHPRLDRPGARRRRPMSGDPTVAVDKIVPRWSAPNRQRASRLLEQYPRRRSAVMPLLYLAMLEHGHLTDDAQRQVGRAVRDVVRPGAGGGQLLHHVQACTRWAGTSSRCARRSRASCSVPTTCSPRSRTPPAPATARRSPGRAVLGRARRVPRRLWGRARRAGQLRDGRRGRPRRGPPVVRLAAPPSRPAVVLGATSMQATVRWAALVRLGARRSSRARWPRSRRSVPTGRPAVGRDGGDAGPAPHDPHRRG